MHTTSLTVNHTCFLILILILLVNFFGSLLTFALTCTDTERQALLGFKQGLTDPSGRLSSWKGNNCCQWAGVGCNNVSGHVTKLDLRNTFLSTSYGIASMADGDVTAYERSCLGGEMNHSLVGLKYLEYLDLSLNDFKGIPIPESFGMLKNLKYLNLSFSSFGGDITPRLGNLSNLIYLDLYSDSLNSLYELHVENLEWLSDLSSLKLVNMGYVKLNNLGAEWLKAVSMIPSLLELRLHACDLQSLPLELSYVNFTSLSVLDLSANDFDSSIPNWIFNLTSLTNLDLSGNSFNSSIPNWIFNLTSLTDLDLSLNSFGGAIPEELANLLSLEYLDLSSNALEGQIPGFIGKFCKLRTLDFSWNSFTGETDEFFGGFSGCLQNSLVSLDLSENELEGELPDSLGILESLQQLQLTGNSFWGSFPASIGSLSSLQALDVSSNKMNGTIPESFGQLFKLTDLNLQFNPWAAVITESHLMNLTSLQYVILRTETIMSTVFNVSNEWVPPFRLISLELENCLVGPRFPAWLRVQNELTSITLKNAGIEDVIPEEWFSTLAPQITNLDLSNNQIKGRLPAELKSPTFMTAIDLSYNRFEGSFPLWSTNTSNFYLQSNLFSGSIPSNIDELMPQVMDFILFENQFNGTIPSTICSMTSLRVLALRNNQISGELPHCWNENQGLWFLDVANNNLSGNIPSSIGLLTSLYIFMLSNNSLVGEIPPSLQNCSLVSIDLGGNRLSGQLPRWIGENRTTLKMIRLSSNSFTGTIPKQWCNLSFLHILVLAHNNLSGFIPSCLGNLTSLIYGNEKTSGSGRGHFTDYEERTIIVAKGQELIYFTDYEERTIIVAKGQELIYSSTLGLVNIIDLSRNSLMGGIPPGITNLTGLGTLNLSMNHLTGSIPGDIGKIRWLETLDLSNNNLSGPIPQSISWLTSLSHLNLSYNSLAGKIPSGNQLQTLNDSSIYAGNPSLCGAPIAIKCPGDDEICSNECPASQGGKEDNSNENDSENLWFLLASIGSGYFVGLIGVCCTLWMAESWRKALFRFFRIR